MSDVANAQLLPPDNSDGAGRRPIPPPLGNVSKFHSRLRRLLKSWRTGLWWSSVLRILAWAMLALAVFALLDYFLALGNFPRLVIGMILLTFLVGALVWETVKIFACGSEQIARRADQISGNRRHPALSALELLKSGQESGFQDYLVKRSVDEANQSLATVSAGQVFPRTRFSRHLWRFLGVGISCAVATVLLWPVASVLLARIIQPWEDIPPYSPLQFVVSPAKPEIFYGEDAVVSVEIQGGEIRESVRFLTRGEDGLIFETLCFKDGPGMFAQRLERVIRPTEFCFAHGRSRSKWHSIDLLMEPKVALVATELIPPKYSGRAPRNFLIGEQPLAGLKGSAVKLSVTSNRPLLDGVLLLKEKSGSQIEEHSVEGTKTGPRTISFEWTLRNQAGIEVSIRDQRGTKNKKPFTIAQKLIVDRPPEIEISEPPLHLMATPSIKISVAGKAQDDLGLGRVELIRNVVGYRDRMLDISPLSLERRFEYKDSINLANLGVQPGETLEFYLEASDRNPSLMGVAASEVARVQIISEEEYANVIRTRTSIKEFTERFQAVHEALRKLKKSLQDLKNGKGDLAEAEKAAGEAAKLFELLSQDFAAYDLEKQAVDGAAETLSDIKSIEQQLIEAEKKGGAKNLSPQALSAMLEKLGLREQQYKAQKDSAESIAAAAEIMELAATFSRIVLDQDNLTRRLKKFELETRSSDLPFLKALGSDQKKIRERLDQFTEQMEGKVGDLPEEYKELGESAQRFVEAIRASQADRDMDESSSSAKKEDGRNSWQYSALALEKLQALIEKGDGKGEGQSFAGLCQGKLKFKLPGSLQETLQQMLAAIGLRGGGGFGSGEGNKPGRGGSGPGGGSGSGGNANDGYSMAGYTALDIPVFGPPRMRLHNPNTQPSANLADGDSSKRRSDSIQNVNENDRMTGDIAGDAAGQAMPLDQVPEKYRDAVKRYFNPTPSTERKATPTPKRK